MKSIKYILFVAVVAAGVFGSVLYTSCTKNSCKGVTCLNGGTCSGGQCTGSCPNGIVGSNCETICELLFANTYIGNASIDSSGAYITHGNNVLTFSEGPDSQYTTMQLTWVDPQMGTVSFTVTLTNYSSCATNGATFTLSTATLDSNTFILGSGSVNGTVASVTLKDTLPNSPAKYITLTNFSKQ